mmetsp:Transcript_54088/g.120967  ORF Transcript_54088/g.120967 Transcript_54088/m.120967 type:complete len:550 (-) Transcript_54088:319-1968(-)
MAIPATAAAVKHLTGAAAEGDIGSVVRASWIYISIIIFSALPFLLVTHLTAIILSEGMVRLQTKISERMIYMEFNESSKFSHEDCQDVFRSDMAHMERQMSSVLKQLLAPFMKLAISLCYVIYVKAEVGILAMSIFPFIFATIPDRRSAKASAAFKASSSKMNAVFSNGLSCHSMIWHTHTQQTWMEDILAPRTSEVKHSMYRMQFWSGVVMGYVTQALQLFIAAHVVILANMAVQGTLSVGDFTGIVALFTELVSPATMLGSFARDTAKIAGATQSVHDFLGTNDETMEKRLLWDWQRNISRNLMRGVVFGQKASSLEDVSDESNGSSMPVAPGVFHRMEPGSLMSFTSQGGGRAPAFLRLFNGYHADGIGLRPENYRGPGWLATQRLKAGTAILSKDPSVLTGTVRDNIRFGSSRSDEELERAALLAGLCLDDSFTLSTEVGGKKELNVELAQRLCLARAICRRPALLLLDEATAGWAPALETQLLHTILDLQKMEEFSHMSVINHSSHITQAMADAGLAETVFKLNDEHLEVIEGGVVEKTHVWRA